MTQVEEPAVAPAHEEPVLTAKLGPEWALRLWHLPVIAVWGLLFLVLNYIPLRGTDLWGHVAWGHWIIAQRALPLEDPYFPLAQGMRVVDTAWLSQVLLAAVDRLGGPPWISNVFALVSLATWLINWRVLYLATRSVGASLLMTAVVLGMSWSRLATVRPENFAWLAFAVLWWLLVSDAQRASTAAEAAAPDAKSAAGSRWRLWLGVPLVMALWANLHGSFLCGLLVLGLFAAGDFFTALVRTRSLAGALAAPEPQVRLLALALALAATFVNPYGPDLVLAAAEFSRNANLRDVAEWQPLAFGQPGAYEFVAGWALGTLLLRLSPRPIAARNWLVLLAFAALALVSRRMIGWFALSFGVALAPLAADLWTRWFGAAAPAPDDETVSRGFPLRGRSFNYSLLALLLVWLPFSLAPLSQPILGSKPRKPEQLYNRETPLALTRHLRENPPKGLVFCPQWWGDWLLRDGPPGIAPFMTSNIHLAPRQVWGDYLRVQAVGPGWQAVLARYAIETVIVDKQVRPEQDLVFRRDANWRLAYEDPQAAVYHLKTPAASQPAGAASPPARAANPPAGAREQPADQPPQPANAADQPPKAAAASKSQ